MKVITKIVKSKKLRMKEKITIFMSYKKFNHVNIKMSNFWCPLIRK